MTPETAPNYLELSDDEIMNMPTPVAAAPAEAAPTTAGTEGEAGGEGAPAANADGSTAGDGTVPQADAAGGGAGEKGEGGEGGSGGEAAGATDPLAAADDAKPDPTKTAAPAAAKVDDGKPADDKAKPDTAATQGDDKTKVTPAAPAAVVNKPLDQYTLEEKAAAFDKVMAPFKANGKEIKLLSPDEAVKLQQMGANYTKKMQALQPVMRVVKMLENNQLLDEGKLSFLIDVSKGDPAAISKLLNDGQLDPMAVDKDKAADYKPGNHQVSDTEVQFQAVLDDVVESATGQELIAEVHGQWDRESKQALFQNPEVLRELNRQKELGFYSTITDEVARLRALGQIGAEIPFLQAYRAVGDMLHDQGRLGPKPVPTATAQEQQPVEVRVAAPAAPAANGDRAKAAAPTKSGAAPAKVEVNFLGQSDEDFMKQMGGRL